MTDIVTRLRDWGHVYPEESTDRNGALYENAAIEIERLREELATARDDALEEAAKVADGFHDAAMKWAEVYCKGFDGETDSQRIAAAIRAMKGKRK
jgi:hypothetical protein